MTAQPETGISKYITLIKHSLNGEQQDYTQGSIPRAVFFLLFQ
jgi:hypothetical protein